MEAVIFLPHYNALSVKRINKIFYIESKDKAISKPLDAKNERKIIMARPNTKWTDEQVEAEIKRLQASEYVKLAKREQAIKNRRRQQMWNLQWMEARGKQLASDGITYDNIEKELFGENPVDPEIV